MTTFDTTPLAILTSAYSTGGVPTPDERRRTAAARRKAEAAQIEAELRQAGYRPTRGAAPIKEADATIKARAEHRRLQEAAALAREAASVREAIAAARARIGRDLDPVSQAKTTATLNARTERAQAIADELAAHGWKANQ